MLENKFNPVSQSFRFFRNDLVNDVTKANGTVVSWGSWRRYLGDKSNVGKVNLLKHSTRVKERQYNRRQRSPHNIPIFLKEPSREPIRAWGFRISNLVRRFTYLRGSERLSNQAWWLSERRLSKCYHPSHSSISKEGFGSV